MKRTIFLALLLALAGAAQALADVVISTDATQNMSCSGGICAPTASDAVLNVTDLENLLASGNVSVVTTNGNVQATNIDIASPFSWSSASELTLDAYQSITFSADVSDAGTGAVSLVTNDGGTGGALTFAIDRGSLDFASTKSPLSINGKTYKLAGNVKQLAKDIAAKPNGKFALSRDYDAGKDGIYAAAPIPTQLTGTFNGLGHAISNLDVEDQSDENVGFFAYVWRSGSISSVQLPKAKIRAESKYANAGALVGYLDGTITNASTGGAVIATYAGGLVGDNYGSIIGSQSGADVHGGRYAGGLVGDDEGKIALSFATGNVVGRWFAGGLVGVGSSIENSYASGSVRSAYRYGRTGDLPVKSNRFRRVIRSVPSAGRTSSAGSTV